MAQDPGATFFEQLRAEKLKAQQTRTAYTLKKLSYATALLGVGALSVGNEWLDSNLVLYLVPWVAIAFDLYVLGEDYSVKRFGAFLGARSPSTIEREWENWVAQRRDPFAPLAMPVLTTLLLAGAATLLWAFGLSRGPVFWIWLAATAVVNWGLYSFYGLLRRRSAGAVGAKALYPPLAHALSRLRAAVERAGFVPDPGVIRQILDLRHLCRSDPAALKALLDLTAEYDEPEYLLCVDSRGELPPADERLAEGLRAALAADLGLSQWLQLSEAVDGRERRLLVARWLCHLTGLRHRTVQLLIDHPTLPDHTLMQVRGLDKDDSPGCFDLPVAGHIAGMDAAQVTLYREMREELGLAPQDLDGLERLGEYMHRDSGNDPNRRNNEFCVIYRCRLRPERWPQVAPVPPEVAGLVVLPVSLLPTLVERFPDRTASGLSASLPLQTRTEAAHHKEES